MNAADLIAELSQRAGLPLLQLSDEGTASLVVDRRTTVNLEHDPAGRRLFAYISLGEPPAAEREPFFAALLAANLFGRGTGGGAIGLDPVNQELLLSRSFDLDLVDYTAFEAALEALVDAAELLLAQRAQAAPEPAPPSGLERPDLHLNSLWRA